jgi:hypothetical protein
MALATRTLTSNTVTMNDSTTVTVSPVGMQEDDWLIFHLSSTSGSAWSGFRAVHSVISGGQVRLHAADEWHHISQFGIATSTWKKKCQAGEAGTFYSFKVGSMSRRITLTVRAYSGGDFYDIVDVLGASAEITAQSLGIPSVTPTDTDRWHLLFESSHSASGGSVTFTQPGSYTERHDYASSSGTATNICTGWSERVLSSAAATGVQTFTISGGVNREMIGQSVLLKAAPPPDDPEDPDPPPPPPPPDPDPEPAEDYEFKVDWNADGDYDDTGEDITTRVLTRSPTTISYGRDQARALSPIGPGEAELELDNRTRDYSPENTSSPLNGLVLPGRPMRIRAGFGGVTYDLFAGILDDFHVLPDLASRSIGLTCVDAITQLRGIDISTGVHRGIRTGEAIGLVLDAAGWPADLRDLDTGATCIPFWWEEGTDALSAIEQLVDSEGPPAMVTADGRGRVVFRDRHHRLIREASMSSQATFRDEGGEPLFSDLVYHHGWRDIANSVTQSDPERAIAPVAEDVWTSYRTNDLAAGETLPITVELTEPAVSAITPVVGTDFTLRTGAAPTVTLSRTSGASITLFLTAAAGSSCTIEALKLRAYPVFVARTLQVHAEDSVSIAAYGRRSFPLEAPWASLEDARAIVKIVLAHRAERLPIADLKIVAAPWPNERRTQVLTRDLSDKVSIIDSETGIDDSFYIERIRHTISGGGVVHEAELGCEKAAGQVANAFRFDTAGLGFGDGTFAREGFDEADLIFRFDMEGRGFNDGQLAH